MNAIVLSHFQARLLLEARENHQDSAQVSLDLGIRMALVELEPSGVNLPDGQILVW